MCVIVNACPQTTIPITCDRVCGVSGYLIDDGAALISYTAILKWTYTVLGF